MKEKEIMFIRGHMLCCTNKPSNRKQGLYHPLLIPTHPWEIISMHFVGGLPTTRKGHDYLFMVFDKFNKMCVMIPCKNTIIGQEATKFFFGQVWVHFGIPRSMVLDKETIFISAFWTTVWEEMDIALNISTTFHP